MVEGDAFNTSKLRRSRQRIRNLGFFERVEINNKAGSSPDKTAIEVSVREKSTGELSFGAGFSSSSGVLADASIRERNLLGRGQDLNLGLKLGEKQQQIDLSFTEPYFLDREVSAGFDVFRTARDLQSESSFDREEIGFSLRAGYKITDVLSQSWKYTIRFQDDITGVSSDASAKTASRKASSLHRRWANRCFTIDAIAVLRRPTDILLRFKHVVGLGAIQNISAARLNPGHSFTLR